MTYLVPPKRRRWATTQTPETKIRAEIKAYLIGIGLRPFRVRTTGAAGFRVRRSETDGLPDLFGILPDGRWWAIEVKAPGAQPRRNEAKQLEVLDYLRHNQAVVIVATSVLEVRAALKALRFEWAIETAPGQFRRVP